MDIRHLQTFLHIVRNGSVSATATELGVSQPAVSKVLRRIESELGVSLFDRLPRGLAVNEYGRTLEDAAQLIDSNLRAALRQIDALRSAFAGELRIGAGATWRDRLVPVAVARLLAARPAVRVSVMTGISDELVAALQSGAIDLALVPVDSPGLRTESITAEPLMSDRLVVVARRGHPLTGPENIGLETLVRQKWAVASSPSGQKRFRNLFQARGLTPPIPSVETEDMNCLLEIVARGELLTYVPYLRMRHRSGADLALIRSSEAELSRETGVLRRTRSRLTPLQREFLAVLRGEVRSLVEPV